ncbi:hypothetical protein [Streptomyces sp. MW-W600-10]|uniref:hypothetical protein n=1 Tax=Streptomyces sp. MW-W600-10 TaxID=2829819 RepID=UPI00210ACCE1|nr:hypothetical protein [Streptomyces sp. MW-W600-10]
MTVTAAARVSRIVWAMGDGAEVVCTSPGTVYQKSFGLKKSPDCGHVYEQPSGARPAGKYAVTATATWTIDWQVVGGGESGQLTEIRDSAVQLAIVESQAVN